MEAFIWLAGLTVFVLGYVSASLENRQSIKNLKRKHAQQIRLLPTFDEGRTAALADPSAVKNAYNYYFQYRP